MPIHEFGWMMSKWIVAEATYILLIQLYSGWTLEGMSILEEGS